jgi:hypothetical protein
VLKREETTNMASAERTISGTIQACQINRMAVTETRLAKPERIIISCVMIFSGRYDASTEALRN